MLLVTAFALLLSGVAAPSADTDTYYIVCLRPNPARPTLPREEGERMQAAHMAHIRSLAEQNLLVAAGPFDDKPTTISGIFVFKTATLEEARRAAGQDPTVVAGRNTLQVLTWRGPAGIGVEYARLHRADPKTPEDMGVHPLAFLRRGATAPDTPTGRQALTGHRAYMQRLRQDGKLAAAGGADADDGLAGIVVFKRIPLDEARTLLAADPAVQAGVFQPEFHRWWCAGHVLPW